LVDQSALTCATDLTGNVGESVAQVATESADGADDSYGNQGHQQAVFHRAGTLFILDKILNLGEQVLHFFVLLFMFMVFFDGFACLGPTYKIALLNFCLVLTSFTTILVFRLTELTKEMAQNH
jgi:hypothetical protein